VCPETFLNGIRSEQKQKLNTASFILRTGVGSYCREKMGRNNRLLCSSVMWKACCNTYGTQTYDKPDIFHPVTSQFVEENLFKLKVIHPFVFTVSQE
jgi:hypothetical protein